MILQDNLALYAAEAMARRLGGVLRYRVANVANDDRVSPLARAGGARDAGPARGAGPSTMLRMVPLPMPGMGRI